MTTHRVGNLSGQLTEEKMFKFAVIVVSLLSCVHLFATPWTVARQALLPWDFSDKMLEWVVYLLQGISLT